MDNDHVESQTNDSKAVAIFTTNSQDPSFLKSFPQHLTGQFNFTQITPEKLEITGQFTGEIKEENTEEYRFWIVDRNGLIFQELTDAFKQNNIIPSGVNMLKNEVEGVSLKGPYGLKNLFLQVTLGDSILGLAKIEGVN
ncbi:355_t:CDS:1 [Acaulospora morrowiae]|uniref:355_t:CDS:1 n=1 Tax=Acaulospora morrowiae TaxID=94023 RepID=A0A9N8YUQ6_9GLOM|nr:355_t:CDS:1 [Acaulospora morrowiae]